MTATKLDKFTKAYIKCALWSTNDQSDERGGEPLDVNYSAKYLALETLEEIIADCRQFQKENADDIATGYEGVDGYTLTAVERAGHDFWLTRNHHGVGFWDGDWSEPAVTRLTKATHIFGEIRLYVKDDELIYSAK